jgi:epoxyqueuosine reductase
MLKTALIEKARELGFAECRFAPADVPTHAQEFRDWLEAGKAGEMGWLERNADRRTDPQLVLPGAKTIVVLAMTYWQGGENFRFKNADLRLDAEAEEASEILNLKSAMGRIARYAWGDDYHDLIEKRLRAFDDFLRANGGVQKCYVDTGPMLERDHAATAGLGWQGKSTMLISRKLGTWFFLAEILTTLEIDADEPARDHCGSCTRCISACPTNAITSPHQLDARRCISYLTIENPGPIPEEFRTQIGDRIYGCDDCLTACPWNRFAQTSHESTFAARDFVHHFALRDYLALDDGKFRALFRKSPIKRIKRPRFLRNVCVALGNTGTPEDLPALQLAAADAHPLIADHARWAITQILSRNAAGKCTLHG